VEITEVRIKLMDEPRERLQAFCSITLDDCFVVRDLKIIEGTTGPFVAMPSRKLTAHCPQCGCKNHLRAAHCNQCGSRLHEQQALKDEDGRAKLYADIAHPINSVCREMIQQRVIQAYGEERSRAKLPGYVPPRYDDYDVEDELPAVPPAEKPAAPPVEKLSPVETPQIQGAEKPHRAHRAPVHAPQPGQRPHAGGFGAGVFD
jgi:stage V sporulation protein G